MEFGWCPFDAGKLRWKISIVNHLEASAPGRRNNSVVNRVCRALAFALAMQKIFSRPTPA
jgi:hypothetical protein